MNPYLLDSQPGDSEPVFYTHFDCWNADGDDTQPRIEAGSPEAAAIAKKLLCDWATNAKLPKLRQLAERYIELGELEFFHQAALIFAEAGWPVYDGDEFFEVYPKLDLKFMLLVDVEAEDDSLAKCRLLVTLEEIQKLHGLYAEVEELINCDILTDECDLAKNIEQFKPID